MQTKGLDSNIKYGSFLFELLDFIPLWFGSNMKWVRPETEWKNNDFSRQFTKTLKKWSQKRLNFVRSTWNKIGNWIENNWNQNRLSNAVKISLHLYISLTESQNTEHLSNSQRRFFQILWPSQITQTLSTYLINNTD